MLAATNLTSLSSRRDDHTRNFFLSITNPASCLHHLLPPPRSNAVIPKNVYPYKAIQFPRAIWPFSLPEQDCQQLTPVSFYACWRFQLLTAIIIFFIIITFFCPPAQSRRREN